VPPVASVASIDATRAMLRADIDRFACVSGTRFGRPVLPLVCSTSATSSLDGMEIEARPLVPDNCTIPVGAASAVRMRIRSPAAFLAASAPSGGTISVRAPVSFR